MARGTDDAPSWHWFGDGGPTSGDGTSEPTTEPIGRHAADPAAPDQTVRVPAQSLAASPAPAPAPEGQLTSAPPHTGQPSAPPLAPTIPPRRPDEHPSRFLPFGQPTTTSFTQLPPEPLGQALGPSADAETAMIPRVSDFETAVIPKVVGKDRSKAPPTVEELAARYGLKPAGSHPRLTTYIKELWRYREFITTYANGRSIAAYGHARLGRLWQLLTPLMNAAVYFLIFGLILGTSRDVDNFIGYLCVGMFVFAYTSGTAGSGVTSISGSVGIVRALEFPRASLPIATAIMQAQNMLLSMLVLVGVILASGEPLTADWIFVVPAFALQSCFNLGLGLFLARLGSKLPDLRQVLPSVLRVWMYSSGVLYSVDYFTRHLPQPVAEVLHANPALVFIEFYRYALMENVPLASTFSELWILGGAWAAVSLLFGFLYFWRGEPEYGRA